MSDRALAFAAAVRVVAGVHNGTADRGFNSEIPRLTRFAEMNNLVFDVAYLSDSSSAFNGNESHFSGRHFQSRVSALFCHNLSRDSRRSRNLRASAGLKLDCVNYGTYGYIRKRESIARLNVRAGARKHFVTDVKTYGREDVSLLAVRISEQSDMRGPVRVVLYTLNRCGDTVLIALEVYNSVFRSVAAAYMTNGYFALVVSAARYTRLPS